MNRDLDEIEMELKGAESMEYKCGFWPSTFGAGVLCGRVILCPMIPRSTCPHRGPIPVEPERVTFPPHCGREEGPCGDWTNCGRWCWHWLSLDRTWAQRMGMCVWPEEQWIVTSLDFGWYTTEEKAMEYVRQNPNKRRAFRWSDGVQG